MAKLLKILAKIIGSTLEWLLILIIAVSFAIRTSTFQTYLAELATDYLSKELDTELHIGKVDIYFFRPPFALDDVFVRDQQGDTLASLGSIDVTLQSLNLSANKMTLRNIALNEGRVGISRDSANGDYNYAFIADYFSSGSKSKGSEPMDVTVRSLDIDQVDITYDDYRKSYNEYGMDYDHLNFKNVILEVNEFESDGETFAFNLEKLSAREKCGIVLHRLKARCLIGYRGILLSNVKINTSRSKIYAQRFNMRMTGLSDVRSFEDSVSFDAMIDSSEVSMIGCVLLRSGAERNVSESIPPGRIASESKELKNQRHRLANRRANHPSRRFALARFQLARRVVFERKNLLRLHRFERRKSLATAG